MSANWLCHNFHNHCQCFCCSIDEDSGQPWWIRCVPRAIAISFHGILHAMAPWNMAQSSSFAQTIRHVMRKRGTPLGGYTMPHRWGLNKTELRMMHDKKNTMLILKFHRPKMQLHYIHFLSSLLFIPFAFRIVFRVWWHNFRIMNFYRAREHHSGIYY